MALCSAPGSCFVIRRSEVCHSEWEFRSRRVKRASETKRVRFSGWSEISSAMIVRPALRAASGLAIAATVTSSSAATVRECTTRTVSRVAPAGPTRQCGMCSATSATTEAVPSSRIASVSGTSPASEFSIGRTPRSTSPATSAAATMSKVANEIWRACG